MAIYELTSTAIRPLSATTFRLAEVRERQDLQRVLRERVDVVSPDTLVIAEEFGEWDDSRRRIDLLAVDREANLVVIELKRTEDGGHMELQAVRYAAMVSTMTFGRAVSVYDKFLRSLGREDDAQESLLAFLDWDEPNEDEFAQQVRIVLASAEFSRELTTAVIWLNQQGLDIRCVRLQPYSDGDRVLLDVQQVLPLPEAEEYQVRVREKSQRERAARTSGRDYTKYDVTLGGKPLTGLSKARAAQAVLTYLLRNGATLEQVRAAAPNRKHNFCCDVQGVFNDEAAFRAAATKQANSRGRPLDVDRFYTDSSALVVAGDRTIAIANGWGPDTHEWLEQVLAACPRCEASIVESNARPSGID